MVVGFGVFRLIEHQRNVDAHLDDYETTITQAEPIINTEYVLQGPFDGFSWYDTMNLNQIEEQLEDAEDPLADRVFNIVGLEVDGRFWWPCDGQWVEMEAPCEVP